MADRSVFKAGEPDVEFSAVAGLRIRPADAEATGREFFSYLLRGVFVTKLNRQATELCKASLAFPVYTDVQDQVMLF
jgi:hypothetical protein